MGGETKALDRAVATRNGPSPRGRGNQGLREADHTHIGSIPAWAGKPAGGRDSSRSRWVHPRVGGETNVQNAIESLIGGPSPRGRGNLALPSPAPALHGSIPAWAGKPADRRPALPLHWVHPRVGGETTLTSIGIGSTNGPSPRGRGNQGRRRLRGPPIGSIPAWAGKPHARGRIYRDAGVHPRVGGETCRAAVTPTSRAGPSPRGRGNLVVACLDGTLWRSIPAWAGKPNLCATISSACMVHPRVGGETADQPDGKQRGKGPSPRGRGNPHRRALWW